MTKEQILKEELAKIKIAEINSTLKQAIYNAMERFSELSWKDPYKDELPPIGTECVINKEGELMVAALKNWDERDTWAVNYEEVECVDEFLVLPKSNIR